LYTPQEEQAILISRHAVLISLDPLRVIVMWNRIVGFVPEGADSLFKTLYINMRVWDSSGSGGSAQPTDPSTAPQSHSQPHSQSETSFEMRAYEAIFGTVVEILKQEERLLREKIDGIVSILNKCSIVPCSSSVLEPYLEGRSSCECLCPDQVTVRR
jgi:hypothetical protein